MPAHLSAQGPSLSIPALGAFQLRLTPFNSTPTSQLREASDEASGSHLRWRTDVAKTRPHWDGWYAGLSKLFVEVKTPKLLLLAGTDRLDVDLTVAQMQGKFQMVVFPNASHATHEDEPGATSVGVAGFIERYVCRG